MIEKFEKYKVQDVGNRAICNLHGVNVVVAEWSRGNAMWVLTKEGAALLESDSAKDVEDKVLTPKQKRARRVDAAPVVDLDIEE